jgi:aryl-alcohol dehydrogenase-like predicted oxidoreductase
MKVQVDPDTERNWPMNDPRPHAQTRFERCSRRRFVNTALAGAGALLAGGRALSPRAFAAGSRGADPVDMVKLGRTGIKTSRLAQGTGWNGGGRSSAHTRLGEKEFAKLIRHALDHGVRMMDTADLYGSHRYVRHALQGVSRDKYEILTKIWPRAEYWNSPSGGAKQEVDRFCKELNTDVLDICLIHCMTNTQWPQEHERIREELSELKAEGRVRAVGVSCHDFGALKVAVAHPWVDVVLARINHVGPSAIMDASVEEVTPVLKQARANGKTVIGMKIYGAGKLTSPDQKDTSLRYVWGHDLVDAITIGMMETGQVDDTVRRLNQTVQA